MIQIKNSHRLSSLRGRLRQAHGPSSESQRSRPGEFGHSSRDSGLQWHSWVIRLKRYTRCFSSSTHPDSATSFNQRNPIKSAYTSSARHGWTFQLVQSWEEAVWKLPRARHYNHAGATQTSPIPDVKSFKKPGKRQHRTGRQESQRWGCVPAESPWSIGQTAASCAPCTKGGVQRGGQLRSYP